MKVTLSKFFLITFSIKASPDGQSSSTIKSLSAHLHDERVTSDLRGNHIFGRGQHLNQTNKV